MKSWKRLTIGVCCAVLAAVMAVPAAGPISVYAAKKASTTNILKLYRKGRYKAVQKMSNRLPKYANEKCVAKMSKKVKNAYLKKVKSYIAKSPKSSLAYGNYIWDYNLTDINKDKIPELLVTYGSCEADVKTYVYTYKKGKARKIGFFYSGHTGLYACPGRNGIIQHMGHMGYESVYLITMKNGKLQTRRIGDRDTNTQGASYIDFPYLLKAHKKYNTYTYDSYWDHSDLL